MHNAISRKYQEWEGRIEIAYISIHALRTFKTEQSQIAIISPGEPFHIKDAGEDWLINWYLVQEKSKTLFGPPPSEIIDHISKEEFNQWVARQAGRWREWIVKTKDSRGYQGYAILTLCRALYASRFGEQVSKKQAAEWAIKEMPDWATLIKDALQWRQEAIDIKEDPKATFPDTERFVNFVIDRIENKSR